MFSVQQTAVEISAEDDRQLDKTVPSVMSPCLPQQVVLSERETLFRSALDTALKNEMQYKHKYLCYSPCQCRNSTIFISGAKTNKTAVQLDINKTVSKTVQKKAISACE